MEISRHSNGQQPITSRAADMFIISISIIICRLQRQNQRQHHDQAAAARSDPSRYLAAHIRVASIF